MISPKKPYLFGRPCFVYVVRCAEFTKVGIALDTVKRISSMLTNCPFPIELIARRQFPSEEVARGVEQMIHSALETQAHRGEWFVQGPVDPVTLLLNQYQVAREFYPTLPQVTDLLASGQSAPPAFDLAVFQASQPYSQ